MGCIGVGKFILILVLFCILESVGGKILIDGVDIVKMGFYDLWLRFIIIL